MSLAERPTSDEPGSTASSISTISPDSRRPSWTPRPRRPRRSSASRLLPWRLFPALGVVRPPAFRARPPPASGRGSTARRASASGSASITRMSPARTRRPGCGAEMRTSLRTRPTTCASASSSAARSRAGLAGGLALLRDARLGEVGAGLEALGAGLRSRAGTSRQPTAPRTARRRRRPPRRPARSRTSRSCRAGLGAEARHDQVRRRADQRGHAAQDRAEGQRHQHLARRQLLRAAIWIATGISSASAPTLFMKADSSARQRGQRGDGERRAGRAAARARRARRPRRRSAGRG
jgi:hypothetical protein